MAKRYITTDPGGIMAIIKIIGSDDDGNKLTKTLFELSRTTDMDTHFDPSVHTRDVIAAGTISGHRAVELLGECEDTDLPVDLYFRNAWEWSD